MSSQIPLLPQPRHLIRVRSSKTPTHASMSEVFRASFLQIVSLFISFSIFYFLLPFLLADLLRPIYTGDFCCDSSAISVNYRGFKSPRNRQQFIHGRFEIAANIASVNEPLEYVLAWILMLQWLVSLHYILGINLFSFEQCKLQQGVSAQCGLQKCPSVLSHDHYQ